MSDKVSLIAVFHNEEKSLSSLLDSIVAQTRLPDEIVFVDDRSTDNTLKILHDFEDRSPVPVAVVALHDDTSPGGNLISLGRNLAIASTKNELIACTDGGCVLDKDWLASIVRQFERDMAVDVVAGYFLPNPTTFFEEVLAAVSFRRSEELRALPLPCISLPTAKSMAFRKSAWAAVGGFPEDVQFGEDTLFILKLHRGGYRMARAEDAVAYKRVSKTPGDWYRKMYRYGRGEGLIGRRPLVYGLRSGAYLCGAGLLGLGVSFPWAWVALAVLALLNSARPYRRAWHFVGRPLGFGGAVAVLLLVPALLAAGDMGKLWGYLLGTIERATGRHFFGHTIEYGV